MGRPTAANQAPTSLDSAAEPETKYSTRPPKRALSFEKTSLSATVCWIERIGETDLPAAFASATCLPTPMAQLKILAFAPPSDSVVETTRA